MRLIDLIPLNELDFTNQDSFDAYKKNHKLRPDTEISIAGKKTTAGQASKPVGLLKKITTNLFGKKEEPSTPIKLDPKHPLNKKTIYTPKGDVTIGKMLSNPEKYKKYIPDIQAAIDTDPNGEKFAKSYDKRQKEKRDNKNVNTYDPGAKWNPSDSTNNKNSGTTAIDILKKIASDDEKQRKRMTRYRDDNDNDSFKFGGGKSGGAGAGGSW